MNHALLYITIIISFIVNGCSIQEQETSMSLSEDIFTSKRISMVSKQIKARGIKDLKILETMEKVPRHEFVPANKKSSAYEDHPLSIGEGQTISQPYIVALMTELLGITENDRILEIGTGSGYQAAIIAELAKEVYSIEIIEELARRAEDTLKKLGYSNIKIKHADGYLGWKKYAPFDGIIVTCAPENVPQPLIDQLAEGGRMVIPVGGVYEVQDLVVLEKRKGEMRRRSVTGVRFVPMTRKKTKESK